MRSRILPAVGASAIALIAASTLAGQASAHNAGPTGATAVKASTVTAAQPSAKACYVQGTDPSGFGISSQDFEADFDAYDDMAADDFTTKKGCTVKTVTVAGSYSNGTSNTTKANVTFYKNAKGKPGKALKTISGKVKDDGVGNFVISLGKKGYDVPKGTVWLSVQAVLDFGTGGQWYWSQSFDGKGADAQWENPNGGFGICPTWDSVVTCNGATETAMIFTLS